MPNYLDGKIYKLVNSDNALCYVGSTTQILSQRRAKHVNDWKMWKAGKRKLITSCKVLDDDENACIVLLEKFPCSSKEELQARERYYIDTIVCVNKVKPGRTYKEYCEDNKDKIAAQKKEYNNNNKDKIALQRKQFYTENGDRLRKTRNEYYSEKKDVINESRREYYSENKSFFNEISKNYREQNVEKIRAQKNKKHNCDCGGSYTQSNKSIHEATKKHKTFIFPNQ